MKSKRRWFLSVLLLFLLAGLGWRLAGCGARAASVAGGVTAGQLAPCPEQPNCVCSCEPADSSASVELLPRDWERLTEILRDMPRTDIVTKRTDYLHATFRTRIMGYVDDVEFLLTPEGIAVRSASRLGYSDLGANRARVEAIRAAF